MLSDPQEIVIAALLWTAFTFAPLYIASANKYAAHKASSSLKRELNEHASFCLGRFTFLGFFMYGLLAAAITVYFWGANPATTSVDRTLYLWTVGVYIFFIACKALCMVHVVYGVEKGTGRMKAWLALGANVFLIVSTAYSTAEWEGDNIGDIIFPLVVFGLSMLWMCVFVYCMHMHCEYYVKCRRADLTGRNYEMRRNAALVVRGKGASGTSSRD